MASFLDKLLSPNVLRDISAMGIGSGVGGRGMDFEGEALFNSVFGGGGKDEYGKKIYKGWDDLSTEAKNKFIKAAAEGDTSGSFLDTEFMFREMLSDYGLQPGKFTSDTREVAQQQFQNTPYRQASRMTGEGGVGDIGFHPFSGESILENLPEVGAKYRRGISTISPEQVKPLSMQDVRKTTTAYYNPYIEERRDPLIQSLTGKRKTAQALGGDFAGYGQRQEYEDVAEGSYLKGIEDVYSTVDTQKAAAMDDLYSTIASWADVGNI